LQDTPAPKAGTAKEEKKGSTKSIVDELNAKTFDSSSDDESGGGGANNDDEEEGEKGTHTHAYTHNYTQVRTHEHIAT
jgi:hypothetical protein